MSGFITIYNTDGEPVDRSLLYSLTQTLKFRGPDKQNVWTDGNIGMSHALFKTTFEAEYENQPATIDKKVWITCSARIDDRENLVNKMGMKKSLDLSKTPDSELILYAYRKWGEACLDHLLGDFAFVIWDKTQQKLFCAKDRLGMRQLYYFRFKNSFIICNNISTLMQHPNISKQFNDKAIAGFLLFGNYQWLGDLSLTAFENVNALKPAHYLIVKDGTFILNRYWDIPSDIPMLHYKKEQDYIEHFLEVFQTAVSDRIRTSSIVIAMSGGMDSTTIASTVNHLRSRQSFEVHAVTAIYEKLIDDNERYYANLAAEHLNIPIQFIIGDKFPMIKSKLITTSPMQIISPDFWFEIQKQFLKYSRAILAGYAGDNLLEYPSIKSTLEEMNPFHLIMELIKAFQRYGDIPSSGFGIKRKIKKILHTKTKNGILQYPSWIEPEFEKKMNLEELFNQEEVDMDMRHPEAYHALLSVDWSKDDILYTDTLSLPEVRDPFIDTRVIELIFSFPSLPWFYKKHILRASMKEKLPLEILNRPKTFIGNLSYAYLKQPENDWVDRYSFIQEIRKYINPENIPPIARGASNPSISDISLRPYYLNEWLKSMAHLSK